MRRLAGSKVLVALLFPLFCVVAQAEDDFHKWVRDCRAGRRKACAKLAQVAKSNSDMGLRLIAVEGSR